MVRSIPEEFDEYLKILERNSKDIKMIVEAVTKKSE